MDFRLKILGIDNDAGRFERGGEFTDVTEASCDVFTLARHIGELMGFQFHSLQNVHRTEVRQGLFIVTFVVDGVAFVVSAEVAE